VVVIRFLGIVGFYFIRINQSCSILVSIGRSHGGIFQQGCIIADNQLFAAKFFNRINIKCNFKTICTVFDYLVVVRNIINSLFCKNLIRAINANRKGIVNIVMQIHGRISNFKRLQAGNIARNSNSNLVRNFIINAVIGTYLPSSFCTILLHLLLKIRCVVVNGYGLIICLIIVIMLRSSLRFSNSTIRIDYKHIGIARIENVLFIFCAFSIAYLSKAISTRHQIRSSNLSIYSCKKTVSFFRANLFPSIRRNIFFLVLQFKFHTRKVYCSIFVFTNNAFLHKVYTALFRAILGIHNNVVQPIRLIVLSLSGHRNRHQERSNSFYDIRRALGFNYHIKANVQSFKRHFTIIIREFLFSYLITRVLAFNGFFDHINIGTYRNRVNRIALGIFTSTIIVSNQFIGIHNLIDCEANTSTFIKVFYLFFLATLTGAIIFLVSRLLKILVNCE